jgi:hypothetical protein
MNKCYLNTYSPYINLLGIIFLIIILIFTIGYYIYISYIYKKNVINKETSNHNNKENKDIIENFACRTVEQSQMDVSMRDCAIYFIKDKEYCDKYYNLYNLGKTQLQAIQYLNKNYGKDKAKKELYEVATNVLNQKFIDPKGLNNKPCKIIIPEWKEINNIENTDGSQNIYPYKNAGVNMDTTFGNILLWGTCFKEIKNDSELSSEPISNESIMRMCDPNIPITNINDINSDVLNQKYMAIDFKSLNGDVLLTSFCSSFSSTGNININHQQKFIKIESFFENNNMRTNKLLITYYDKNQNKFFDLPEYDVYKEYLKLFRFTYDKSKIYFGPLKRNVTAKIMYVNECGKYTSDTDISCFFSLKDFGINDKLLTSAQQLDFTNTTPTSEYIDYISYIETKIKDFITELLNKNNLLSIDLENITKSKKKLEDELNTLENNYKNSPDTFIIPYTVENPVYNSLKTQIQTLQRNLKDSPPTLSVNKPVTNPQIAITQSELNALEQSLLNTDKFNYTFIPDLRMETLYYGNIGRWGHSFDGLEDAISQKKTSPNILVNVSDINIFDPDWQESQVHLFSGSINIEIEGYYNFIVDGDDDCDLIINGILVSHYYGGHGRGNQGNTTDKPLYIKPGVYPIFARMLEWWGASSITAYFYRFTENEMQTLFKNNYYIFNYDKTNIKKVITYNYININSYNTYGKQRATLLQINGSNRTNYVFVFKKAEPNPVYNDLQREINAKKIELQNIPATVDNYEIITNSIYTDLQNQINKLQKNLIGVQPLLGKTRIETNQQKKSLAVIIEGKRAVIGVVNSTLELITSKMQANNELSASLSSLKTYLINGPNINEVNNIIKAGVSLGNINNYQKCVSTDNNIYILIDY